MRKTPVASPAVEVISHHVFANVRLNCSTNQKSMHAAVAFEPGQLIAEFHAGITQSYATYLTVQIDVNIHITLQPVCLQYINHSCNPNTFFDTAAMEVICLKSIAAGEELSFFYPATEWEMSQPFVCNCQSKDCLQLINGASHLDRSTLEKYRLTDFIKRQLAQRIPG